MNEKWNKTALPYVISPCSHVLNVGAAALYLDFERYEKLGSNYNGTVRCSTVGGNVRWLVARLIRRLWYVLNQFFIEETGMHVYLLKAKIPLIRKSRNDLDSTWNTINYGKFAVTSYLWILMNSVNKFIHVQYEQSESG